MSSGFGDALFGDSPFGEGESDPVTQTPDDGWPYLAVDVQPDVTTGVFSVDVSDVGGPDVLLIDAGATWLNIVCDVLTVEYQRGASRMAGTLTLTEAGTATIVLEDATGQFDPMTNRELIHKGSPLRIRAWSTDDSTGSPWDAVLFTGTVDRLGVEYRREDPPLITITVLDVIGVVAGWESEGREAPGIGSGDTLRDRVDRMITETGIGSVSVDSDATFAAALAPTVLAKPWQELQAAVEAELGRLWVNRDNQWVVRSRTSELSGTVRGTLSDVHPEAPVGVHCCMAAARPVYGPENLTNRVLGQRRLPAGDAGPAMLVRRDDAFSQTRYGVSTVDRRSLELSTDDQVTTWAEALIVGRTTPELRVDTVTPQPPSGDLDVALAAWEQVCLTDVGDRWLFRYRTVSDQLVEQTVGVLGITATLSPESWTISWVTAPAPAAGSPQTFGWFVPGISQLDGNDLLAPFAMAVP